MKREAKNTSIGLLLVAAWLFQFSFHAYHIFSEHTGSKVSISEKLPIIKKLDDGSLSCHLCDFLNNHAPTYFQGIIALLTIVVFAVFPPSFHFVPNPRTSVLGKILLRGPPSTLD